MPLVAVILFGLALSGYVMWLYPKYKRWQKRVSRPASGTEPPQ
jgi:hypothetical protein